ncbi:unnamed protein product [Microthlaspi erraticum]|uniref:Uncharacterized protein n=1 Tax=Microthlaspi erraticum TaxID=1685480 RepID=A0A6D2JJT3_9BRAS|nr:unnamed protein product [Microthlaspi erraticum]
MPSLRVGSRLRTYKPGLDRVEAWPVELRNSTGWSSGRSSWSSRWLLPSSFACPVELLPCAKSLHAPHYIRRPFLATAGAIIDVKNGKIDLHLGDIVMNFEVNKSMEKPTVDGQAFWIGELAETREEVLDELLLIDPLELALTKAEMSMDTWKEKLNA